MPYKGVACNSENGGKRTIEDTISPSKREEGAHVESPHPLRRKSSMPDLTKAQSATSSALEVTYLQRDKSCDIIELVKSAVASPEVIEAISSCILPSLSALIKPLTDKLESQTSELSSINLKLDTQNKHIEVLSKENRKLKTELKAAEAEIDELREEIDSLEQYGRRSSLRFHNVPATVAEGKVKDTGSIILGICNDKLKVTPPLTKANISRSHTIGKIKDGKAQIICKFNSENIKFEVFNRKQCLKTFKTDDFNVFITEDLTRKRQQITGKLGLARKKVTSTPTGQWMAEYFIKKNTEKGEMIVVNLEEISHLIPDDEDSDKD